MILKGEGGPILFRKGREVWKERFSGNYDFEVDGPAYSFIILSSNPRYSFTREVMEEMSQVIIQSDGSSYEIVHSVFPLNEVCKMLYDEFGVVGQQYKGNFLMFNDDEQMVLQMREVL